MATLNTCSVDDTGALLFLSFSDPVTGLDAVEYAIEGEIPHALSAATPTGDDPGPDFVMSIDPPLYQGEIATLAYFGASTVDTQDPPAPLDAFSGKSIDNASTVPPPNPPPAAPTGLAAVGGNAQVQLSWNSNTEPDLATYTVYRTILLGGDFVAIATTDELQYLDSNSLVNGVASYYRVSASDTAGNESALTEVVSAIPRAPASPFASVRLSLGLSLGL